MAPPCRPPLPPPPVAPIVNMDALAEAARQGVADAVSTTVGPQVRTALASLGDHMSRQAGVLEDLKKRLAGVEKVVGKQKCRCSELDQLKAELQDLRSENSRLRVENAALVERNRALEARCTVSESARVRLEGWLDRQLGAPGPAGGGH